MADLPRKRLILGLVLAAVLAAAVLLVIGERIHEPPYSSEASPAAQQAPEDAQGAGRGGSYR